MFAKFYLDIDDNKYSEGEVFDYIFKIFLQDNDYKLIFDSYGDKKNLLDLCINKLEGSQFYDFQNTKKFIQYNFKSVAYFLKNMIDSKHINPDVVKDKIIQSYQNKGARYFVWEDFIDPVVYNDIEKEIQSQEYKKVDTHNSQHRTNKTVLLEGKKLQELFNFFESSKFEKYLSLFLRQEIRQEFYIDKNELNLLIGGKEFSGAVAQIYEKGDFFDWHIDGPIEEGSLGAFTYYLGGYDGRWEESYGGNLEFGKKDSFGNLSPYNVLNYKKNTLVLIVASNEAYHRVTRLKENKLRLSIQSTIMKK